MSEKYMNKDCVHQFIKITPIDRSKGVGRTEKILGVRVGCAYCGEVRDIWENGNADIISYGSKRD